MNIDPTILDSQELDKSLKYFLTILASYADTSGKCWPNQATIGRRMGVSARSVRKYLKQVVELQFVSVRRRWRKSNVYTMLCLVQAKLSPTRKHASEENKPTSIHTNVPCHQRHQNKIKPKELSVCYQDIQEVIGEEVLKRNKSWLRHMIIRAGYDKFQDAIHWLRTAIREGQVEDRPIKKPSAILTWYLRTQLGVEV